MSDKFLNGAGLGALRTWVLGKLGLKQDTLVSGTNIKTINNTSLLGSGNINIQGGGGMELVSNPTANNILLTDSTGQAIDSGVNLASKVNIESTYENVTSIIRNEYGEAWIKVEEAAVRLAQLHVISNTINAMTSQAMETSNLFSQANLSPSEFRIDIEKTTNSESNLNSFQMTATETTIQNVVTPTNSGDAANKQYVDNSVLTALNTQATDSTLGTIKLNPNESVTLNANGQLNVGGRLGQFGAAGIFHAKDRDPRNVGEYSFLITDALGMDMQASRSFAVASGIGISGVISGKHPAGCTEYYIRNTYANRLMCAGLTYMSKDEATSKVQRVVAVESITINGNALTPDSSADDNSNPIIIKTAESLNPDSALTATSIRGFRSMIGYASAYIGSAVGADTGGAQLILGQGCFSKTGNMNVMLGQYHYNQGNGNTLLGRQHISKKNRWLLAGTGHDNTNGQSEAGAAVGQYSSIGANTLFAVGNGTSATVRSNAFEVLNDGIVLKSPNGTRYKITVSDTGEITTTAL